MKKILLWTFFLILFSSSCSIFQSDEYSLPNKFNDLSEYNLSDFHLNGNYIYWEVRKNGLTDSTKQKTILSYDKNIYQNLSNKQRKKIKSTTTKRGFVQLCIPGGCSGYGVALKENTVKLIISEEDLLSFFGPIDTEAELNVWLWANFYTKLISYKKEEAGYKAIVKKNNFCGKIKKKLILVNQNGSITELRTISAETYQGCY